ncbi:MAG: hypothetical protein ABSG65_08750 [Bryobacteraceae bacterium]
MSRFKGTVALVATACVAIVGAAQTGRKDTSPPPSAAVDTNVNDPVARLEKRLETGEVSFSYEPGHGYLRAVLDALHVPVSSQTLVFSKTSFQYAQISAAAPRALYFNDDVYVGQVHDGKFLELASFDPRRGAIFYLVDERQSERPRFQRTASECVKCHVASSTRGVPGVMLRSLFTKPSGFPVAGMRSFVTGQESPIGERWGGWYVSARGGAKIGMGHAIVSGVEYPGEALDTSAYLTGSSDIVALMVLAHQTQMHNLITQTNYRTRLALSANGGTMAGMSDASHKQFEDPAEQLVRYLLFTNEARLDGAVAGDSGFTHEFAARGPFDSRGRSLRQFDLHARIFRYPCSYLIYSETFDAIPQPAKQYIYRRLFEVLSGADQSAEFRTLSAEDRRAILEILVDTKPGVPPEWRQCVRVPRD